MPSRVLPVKRAADKDLSDKEREKVREILSKGELVEESTMEDDAIIDFYSEKWYNKSNYTYFVVWIQKRKVIKYLPFLFSLHIVGII